MLRTGKNNNNNSPYSQGNTIDVIKQREWQLLCERKQIWSAWDRTQAERGAAADDLQCGKSLHGETSAVDETRLTSERHKVFSLFA